jgi:hypothetical protein
MTAFGLGWLVWMALLMSYPVPVLVITVLTLFLFCLIGPALTELRDRPANKAQAESVIGGRKNALPESGSGRPTDGLWRKRSPFHYIGWLLFG